MSCSSAHLNSSFGSAFDGNAQVGGPSILALSAGTVSYCAPELLKEGKLTKATDVYSFAMIMWEMYSGTALFRGMNSSQVSSSVQHVGDASLLQFSFGTRYHNAMFVSSVPVVGRCKHHSVGTMLCCSKSGALSRCAWSFAWRSNGPKQ